MENKDDALQELYWKEMSREDLHRVLGMVLGLVRGLMVAWIAVALLIPVTTLVSAEHVPAMMQALQHTTAAKVLYDVNPFLYVIKYAFM